MAVGSPSGPQENVRATWYGNTHTKSQKFCYGGYRNTCSPYSKGEKVMYAAVPGFKWGDRPYKVNVCHKGKCVVVTVRDCLCSRKGKYIDLSPAAFIALGGRLSRGVLSVSVDYDYVEWRNHGR